MEVVLQTSSPDDTRAAGEALAELLQTGDAIVLCGDLGAGKTTLVQGVARGLGIDAVVTSPTFTLVKEYEGRLPLTHVDVFRLQRLQDVVDLELEESDGVMFIEWGDVVEDLLPEERLRIELTTDVDDARRLVVESEDRSWTGRWERLEQALEPWTERP
jgi:tRNA threonylcarbamoyladenosine biosynthesis protein TsaE